MNDYIAALLFFLPAGVANMTPVIINKIPVINKWDTPMDFGRSWHGKRILGDNKRLRGLALGTLMGGITAVLVAKINANTVVTIDPFWVGVLLGLGALLGDALESFLKRQNGIAPGKSWFPFDQADYILGGLVLIYPFVHLPYWAYITVFIVYFGLHLLVVYAGYKVGIRKYPI